MVDEQHGREEGGPRLPASVGADEQGGPPADPVTPEDAEEARRDRDADDPISRPGGMSPSGEDADTPERPA